MRSPIPSEITTQITVGPTLRLALNTYYYDNGIQIHRLEQNTFSTSILVNYQVYSVMN